MSFAFNLPLFLVVLSLVTSVVASVLPRRWARGVVLGLSLASVLANIVVFLALDGSAVTYMMGHFPHPWGNEIRLSPLEALISIVFSLVLFLTMLGGEKHLADRVPAWKEGYFYVMCALVQASMLVLVYTNDIFTGYVFIEICTISSCGLLMIRRNGKTILASVRYMIFALVGSGLFLFGVIFLYNITGHLLMPNLRESVVELWKSGAYRLPLLTAICLITVGLGIKSGLCPFHLWMADTYGAAIPMASGILSGLVSKAYIFFLVKIILCVFSPEVFYASGIQNVIFGLGVCGIVIGSLGAIGENNILRMTAFSSAAQIGYVYMGIGISPTLGILAAVFHMVAHAVTKPAIFLSAGMLSDSMGGAKKFKNLQGAGFVNPVAGVAFTIESFSMIGIPLSMGFVSKYMFGVAAFESRGKMLWTLVALAISTILNTLYFARTILRLYNRDYEKRPVVRWNKELSYTIAAVLFVALNLYFGIFSKPFVEVLSKALTVFQEI